MKKLIAMCLIALLLISSVFATSTSLNNKDTDNDNIYKETKQSIEENKINSDIKTESKKEDSKIDKTKKQNIFEAILRNTRDFVIFEDPAIFQEFAQFQDYVTMFEVYMEYLYVDELDAEEATIDDLYVDEIDADEIYVDELEANEIQADEIDTEELYVGDEMYANDAYIENLESESANIDEIDTENLYAEELEAEEIRLSDGEPTDEIAFACLDNNNILFRSHIPCNELNNNNNMELTFNSLETIDITYQNQEFEIKLSMITPNSAVFKINGDYEHVEEGDETNVNGLIIEIQDIQYNINGEFEELTLSIEGLGSTGPIMIIEDLPINFEFNEIYDNFRFDLPGVEVQDIELLGVSIQDEAIVIEVNDGDIDEIENNEVKTVGGITIGANLEFNNQGEPEEIQITVYDVAGMNQPDDLYPYHFIENGEFEGKFVIGANAATTDVIIMMDLVSDMNNYANVNNNDIVLDNEITYLEDQNIIAVGTACDNEVIYNLFEGPENCSYYEQPGMGILYAVEVDEDVYTLIVDGYGYDERNVAKDVLINWNDYENDFDLEDGICIYLTQNETRDLHTRDYIVTNCD